MRVLVIAQYFPPDIGGASNRVWNAIEGLRRRGHKITAVAAFPHYPDGIIPEKYRGKFIVREKIGNVEVIRVWVPPLPHSGFLRRLLIHLSFTFSSVMGILVTRKSDIIWGVSPYPPFTFIPGKICKLIKKCLFVMDVVDPWPDTVIDLGYIKSKLAINLIEVFSRLIFTKVDAITTTSPSIKEGLRKRAPEKAIFIVEEGVDTQVFYPIKDPDKSILGFETENKFIVMYSGILGPAYDFDSILMAAKELEKISDILFVIKGRGECERDIHSRMSLLKLNNLILRNQYLERKDLVTFLNSADILLLPMKKAYDYVFPTKLYEYLACGKPIVCGAEGEVADLIHKLNTGLVIEPESPEKLRQAVLYLFKRKKLRNEMSKRGFEYISQNVSIDTIGYRLESFFYQLSPKIHKDQIKP